MAFCYILRCADGSFYIGHTFDLGTRLNQHQCGRGSPYTACRRPIAMIYAEEHASIDDARRRERQLKRWSRVKKEALIAGELGARRPPERPCRGPRRAR
jgi:putative endonuclease